MSIINFHLKKKNFFAQPIMMESSRLDKENIIEQDIIKHVSHLFRLKSK